MYGLTLLVAILACIGLTGRRWVAQGGDWDLVTRVAVWGVAFGVIGARAYHDITSWNEVPTPKWQGIFEVWKGGLGVWGGIAPRRRRRRDDRPPRRRERPALHGRRRARPAPRAGHRAHRQLVEPGALRQADQAAVGAQDRSRAPAGGSEVPRLLHVPPDVPLRADLGRDRRARPPLDRPSVQDEPAEPVRPVRRLVLLRPLLRGTAADRPRAPHRRAAPQRLGEHRRVRRARSAISWCTSAARARPQEPKRREPPKPAHTMAIPKGRVR